MTAARTLSGQGYRTYLVEKEARLGGQARYLRETWQGEDVQRNLARLIDEITADEDIEVLLGTEVQGVEGFVGNFETRVKSGGSERILRHGVTIIASGALEYRPEEYLYGEDPNVLTGLELDRRLIEGDFSIRQAKAVVFLQCVGSRTKARPYCSRTCCTHSVRSALGLKEINPEMDVFVVHRDMRTYGLREALYRRARELGVQFLRYDSDKGVSVDRQGKDIRLRFNDRALRRRLEVRADYLILAAAIVPPQGNPLSQMYKVPVNADGFFMEAHVKLRPVDCATDGVFICGLARAPKPIDESISQAQAAAARAITLLAKGKIRVSGNVAQVNPLYCAGCGVCVDICPFGAPSLAKEGRFEGRADVNPVLCKGCGLCVASCRCGAITLKGFGTDQIMAVINEV